MKIASVLIYLLIAVFFLNSKSWAPDESTNRANPYQVPPPAPTTATESVQTGQVTSFYAADPPLVNGGELTPAFFTALALRLAATEQTDDTIEKITTELISRSFPAGSNGAITQWPDPDLVLDLHPAVLRGMAKSSTAEAVRKFAELERGRSYSNSNARSKFFRFYMEQLRDLKFEAKGKSNHLLIDTGLLFFIFGVNVLGLKAVDAYNPLAGWQYPDKFTIGLTYFSLMAGFMAFAGSKGTNDLFDWFELRRRYRLLSETVEPPVVHPPALSQRCAAAARRLILRK